MRLVSVQILRGVAAMLVVVVHSWTSHYPGTEWSRAGFGGFGVDLFFVISGFVMAHVMGRYAGKPGEFALQRYLRIAPLAYLTTAGYLVAYCILGMSFDPMGIVSSITFLPIFGDYVVLPFTVQWTLSFEAVLYAIVCIVIVFRGNQKHLLTALVVLASIGSAYTFETPILRWFTNPILFEFALGVSAYLMQGASRRLVMVGLFVGLGVLALQIITGLRPDYQLYPVVAGVSLLRATAWGLPAFLIFNAVLLWEPKGRLVPLGQTLGDASYSIYLVHFPVVLALVAILPTNPLSWLAILFISASCGVVVYLCIERTMTKGPRFQFRRQPSYIPR